MPLFTLIGRDRPGAGELRVRTRDAHLAYLAGHGAAVKLGGPFMDAAGASTGSLVIVEAADLAAAQVIAAADPYAQAGLFDTLAVEPWRVVVGELA